MENSNTNKAVERFNKLWKNDGDKLRSAAVIPAVIQNGEIYPTDYCISTIARLLNQPNGNEIVSRIKNVLSDLYKTAETQYSYPDESLHISLLGCTQRQETNTFDDTQINKIKDICIQEISKQQPAEISLKGIGIVGNQIFIQGIPMNRNWEMLRASLDQSLVSSGEHPISYEDKSPIHINIIRIVNSDPELLAALHKVITQLRDIDLGTIKLSAIDFVITDFCVSQNKVIWLDQIECCNADHTGEVK